MTYKQHGNALIITLIVVAALAILGAVGFFAWQKFHPTASNQTNTSKTPEDTKPTPSTDAPVNDDYLVLEDWGIRFKKVDALSSTTIKYSVKGDTYSFTTARIEALGGECAKEPYNVTVSLIRTTDSNPGPMTRLNDQPINGYYYMTYGPPASCSGFDANGQMQAANPIETNDRASLKEMLATISTSL